MAVTNQAVLATGASLVGPEQQLWPPALPGTSIPSLEVEARSILRDLGSALAQAEAEAESGQASLPVWYELGKSYRAALIELLAIHPKPASLMGSYEEGYKKRRKTEPTKPETKKPQGPPEPDDSDADEFYEFGSDPEFRVIKAFSGLYSEQRGRPIVDAFCGVAVTNQAKEFANVFNMNAKSTFSVTELGHQCAKECASAWTHKMNWHLEHYKYTVATGMYSPHTATNLYMEPIRFANYLALSRPFPPSLSTRLHV